MGAEYLSYVKSIATFAPTFYGYIISVLVSVCKITPKITQICNNRFFKFFVAILMSSNFTVVIEFVLLFCPKGKERSYIAN